MTPEEKRAQMTLRDASICAYYEQGHKVSECASHFKLARQRVIQILQRANVWRPYVKNNRNNFLGVSISDDVKTALQEEAKRQGVSMSALSAEAIEEMLTRIQQKQATA